MNRLPLEQRFQVVEIYFQSRSSISETYRALRPFYGRHNRPEQAIRSVMDNFCITYLLHDVRPTTRQRNVRAEKATQLPKPSIF